MIFFFIPNFSLKGGKKVEGRIDNPEKIKTTKEISRGEETGFFLSFSVCLMQAMRDSSSDEEEEE